MSTTYATHWHQQASTGINITSYRVRNHMDSLTATCDFIGMTTVPTTARWITTRAALAQAHHAQRIMEPRRRLDVNICKECAQTATRMRWPTLRIAPLRPHHYIPHGSLRDPRAWEMWTVGQFAVNSGRLFPELHGSSRNPDSPAPLRIHVVFV